MFLETQQLSTVRMWFDTIGNNIFAVKLLICEKAPYTYRTHEIVGCGCRNKRNR